MKRLFCYFYDWFITLKYRLYKENILIHSNGIYFFPSFSLPFYHREIADRSINVSFADRL